MLKNYFERFAKKTGLLKFLRVCSFKSRVRHFFAIFEKLATQ